MSIRHPCVAGQFYEGDPEALLKQVRAFLPKKSEPRQAKALLVPHAGLVYSGRVAGEVYASLLWPSTVIFLGTNHTGRGKPFGVSGALRWRTPLGDVRVDREGAQLLLEAIPELEEDDASHRDEHSLEVQLPFLQFFSKESRMIPITIGLEDFSAYQSFGRDLASAVSRLPAPVVVIASSDMTHYEPDDVTKEKDQIAIEAILALDADELLKRVKRHGISMCGFAPVSAMIAYVREIGALRGELVRYETSGDVSGDRSAVVGYAGVRIP